MLAKKKTTGNVNPTFARTQPYYDEDGPLAERDNWATLTLENFVNVIQVALTLHSAACVVHFLRN